MSGAIVYRPDSIPALVEALQTAPGNPVIVAGGTDLVIKLQKRKSEPESMIILGNVPEMRRISPSSESYIIGACVCVSQLEKYKFPLQLMALQDAAHDIGSVQIRNIATIGGNIANASPSADFQPVLMSLGATAQVLRPDGSVYELEVSRLVLGSAKTALAAREVILGFRIPLKNDVSGVSVYQKLGYRKKVSVTRIGLAIYAELDDAYALIQEAQVWLSAVAPKAIYAEEASLFLNGKTIDTIEANMFAELLSVFVAANSPRVYKTYAVRGLALDVLSMLNTRCNNINNY